MENEKLVQHLLGQLEEVVSTLMKLRTPENAYEILRAVDCARQTIHWIGDANGLLKINSSK